jgi:hypothetical protein
VIDRRTADPPTPNAADSNLAAATTTATLENAATPPTPAAAPGGSEQPGTDAAKPASKPKLPTCSQLPDPPPLRTDRWVAARLRLEHGTLVLVDWQREQTRRPEVTPRKMGRFAAELWIGCELIERVRFDFPLLGGEGPEHRPHDPNFESGTTFEIRIRLPESERATRLELIDRGADRRALLDWPLRERAR